MTHVLIFRSKNGMVEGFNLIGHAEYGDIGEDIVCAGISILAINTINSLEKLASVQPSLTINEEEGLMDCRFFGQGNEKSALLIDSMILGLKGIRKQYGEQYLDLTFEEV